MALPGFRLSGVAWRFLDLGNLIGGVWIEGLFARLMYLSLYKMHEIALHGVPTVLLYTLARRITRRTEPH
jgi:NADH:ubiquinone reductase (H+-translocating)